jgi:cob(I)alamin adenosyltransferase
MTIDSNLAKVDEVMNALYDIHDPEIGMSIVDLDLIKNVEIGVDGAPTEIKMVLTTPFCPWAGELIQTIKTKTEEVVGPLTELVLRLQRELFVVGAELATHVDRRQRLTDGVTRVTAEMTTALEHEIDALEAKHPMPVEFVIPGETLAGAALDLARTSVRRAERRAVALNNEGGLPDSQVVPYLNRLADLLFVAARAADGGFRPLRTRE